MRILLILLMVIFCYRVGAQAPAPSSTLVTEVNVDTKTASAKKLNTKGKTVAQQFKDGILYYNAMPTTSAVGSAVKVIDSKDDKDYVCKTYKLKTKGIAVELASFLQTTIDLENGKINVSVDVNTGDGCSISFRSSEIC